MRQLPEGNQVPPSGVTAAEVAARLVDADDPMSFIKNNLSKRATPEQIVTGEAPGSSVVTPPASSQPQPAPPSGDLQFKNIPPPPAPHAQTLQQQRDALRDIPVTSSAAPVEPVAEPSLLDEVKKAPPSKEENAKEARRKISELNSVVAEKEALLTSLQEEVEQYKRGDIVPEPIKKKIERVAQLEQYEELHALRLSPKYQQKYVEPIEALKDKAIKLAADYNVAPEILDEAMNIGNRRDRNAFLKNHFDDIGALEVRGALEEIDRLSNEATEAEKQPGITFERLQREHRIEQQARESARYEGLNRTAQQGWNEALTEIKSEGAYPELVLTGDPKHDAIVKPILQAAAEAYGEYIKLFGVKKMEDLPPEAAKILSKRFLLSQATGVAMASREHHYRRAEEVIGNTQRDDPYMRPQIGSSGIAPSVPSVPPKRNLEDAAGDLLNSVLRKG